MLATLECLIFLRKLYIVAYCDTIELVYFSLGLFTENPTGLEDQLIALTAHYVNETSLPKKSVTFEILSATQPTVNDVQASIKGTLLLS